MPTLSESKKTQITDALVKCGVQPSEGVIAQIVELMKNDGRLSIPTACKRLAETMGTNHAQSTTRSQQSAQVAQGTIQDKVSAARNAVRRSIKAEILIGGIGDALADIAEGRFDDLELEAIAALDDFTHQLNQTRTLLIEAETNPIPLSLVACIEAGECA